MKPIPKRLRLRRLQKGRRAPARGVCVFCEAGVSLYVRVHRAADGLVVELTVVVDPPPPAGAVALAA